MWKTIFYFRMMLHIISGTRGVQLINVATVHREFNDFVSSNPRPFTYFSAPSNASWKSPALKFLQEKK